jgi:hypothetical protein
MKEKKDKVEVSQEDGKTTISGTAEAITDALREATENIKPRKEIEIKSASLKSIFGHFNYDHRLGNDTTNRIKVKSEVPVHDDYISAFGNLDVHLAIICEEIEPRGHSIEELLSNKKFSEKIELFSVSGFRLEGNVDDPQVVLVGNKRLKAGGYLGLETPKTKLNSGYPYAHEFSEAIDHCIYEVEQYKDGKRAPEVQGELKFEADKFDEEE